MSALDLLTGDAQTFVAKVWASRVHIHETSLADDAVGLLTLADADRLLTASAIRTPAIRLVQDGTVLPEASYTRRGATLAGKPLGGLVDARTALTRFDEGATVVLQGLHRYHPPVADLVAELELELGHPCQANAYLTPAGSQGFAVHRDTHDVFVLQMAGTKLWNVGDPTAGQDTPSVTEDVRMEPGIAMYLPTGTPHAARAQSEVSLHVTIGVNQLTWRGLLRRGVGRALDRIPAEHLPAGYLSDDGALRQQLAERLEALAADLRSLDAGEVLDAEVRRFLTTRPSRHPGGLRDTIAAAAIDDDTLLRRIPGRPCVLQHQADQPDRLIILLGDRWLDVPARLEPAVERVRQLTEVRPADLSDVLHADSRLVLCRRLVREGLLTTRTGSV